MSLFDDDSDDDSLLGTCPFILIEQRCTVCFGRGKYDMSMCHGFGKHNYHWAPCYACDQTGLRSVQDEKLMADRPVLPETD